MGDKSLKDKAIDLKGKKYVLVSDRVLFFNDSYPNGSIATELLSLPSDEIVVVKAVAIPDVEKPAKRFTGHSQAKWGDGFVNKTSALENAETSAIGRALAMMGIGVLDSIASVDELKKAELTTPYQTKSTVASTGKCPECFAPDGRRHATYCGQGKTQLTEPI